MTEYIDIALSDLVLHLYKFTKRKHLNYMSWFQIYKRIMYLKLNFDWNKRFKVKINSWTFFRGHHLRNDASNLHINFVFCTWRISQLNTLFTESIHFLKNMMKILIFTVFHRLKIFDKSIFSIGWEITKTLKFS